MCGLDFFFLADIFFWPKAKKKILSQEKKVQTTYFSEHLSLLRQTKKITQPKRIYSANGNPFMPMIYRFYAPLLFLDLLRRSGEGEKAQTTHFPEHLSILQTNKNSQPKRTSSANETPYITMICSFVPPYW